MKDVDKGILRRHSFPGIELTVLERRTHQELHLTLWPLPGEKPVAMVRRLAQVLKEREASIVRHEVFGAVALQLETVCALKQEFGKIDWPVMWVEGVAANEQGISGMNVFAVSGTRVDTLNLEGCLIGRVYNDGYAQHCLLGEVRPLNPTHSRENQCLQTFEQMKRALDTAGMSMRNVARTWLYLDEILDWYGVFNRVRNDFFREQNVFNGLMPASTGIGGKNPWRTALIAGAWATDTNSADILMNEVLSPKQQASLDYGSAFSRAVEITTPDCSRLMISGTASIEKNGKSVCQGNVQGQIELTMQVVQEILSSKGLSYSDATRATAYFKDIRDATIFETWRSKNDLDVFPVLMTRGEICRDELLFEIELDAVSK